MPGRPGANTTFYHRLTLAALVMFSTQLPGGCGKTASLPTLELDRSESRAREPLPAEPPEGATVARFAANPARLPIDVGRAIDNTHWGRLRTRYWIAPDMPTSPADSGGGGPPVGVHTAPSATISPQVVVHATAMLPDGRQARIVAFADDDAHVTAAARVGQFGDPDQERQYLDELQSVLAGKPKRARNKKFKLP